MPEQQKTPQREHSVLIKNRNGAELTGVTQVVSYDERTVNLVTEYGAMCVAGSSLVIQSFEQKSGGLRIGGSIDAVYYAKSAEKKGSLVSRLLK